MKNSRTLLNKPFYDWIKEVREADKKIKELEDKLYYYNVKLIGYNSPNFEPRLSSTKPEYKDNRYFWIIKIDDIQNEINTNLTLVRDFKKFKTKLTKQEKEVLMHYYDNNKVKLNVSKSYSYVILNNIALKFYSFI